MHLQYFKQFYVPLTKDYLAVLPQICRDIVFTGDSSISHLNFGQIMLGYCTFIAKGERVQAFSLNFSATDIIIFLSLNWGGILDSQTLTKTSCSKL